MTDPSENDTQPLPITTNGDGSPKEEEAIAVTLEQLAKEAEDADVFAGEAAVEGTGF